MSLDHYRGYDVEQDIVASKRAVIGQFQFSQMNRANR